MRLAATLIAAPMIAGLCLITPAYAGDLVVALRQTNGAAVADAVVMVKTSARGTLRLAAPARMAQREMQFDPFILVVPVGAEVAFPNLDPVLHHVYSFSAAKNFELKLYGRDQTRKVIFDKPGVVGIGCNIHDDMSAYIRVVDTPFAAKSGAGGSVTLRGLPAGAATITIWHPYLKAAKNEIVRDVVIPGTGDLNLALKADLRPARLRKGDY